VYIISEGVYEVSYTLQSFHRLYCSLDGHSGFVLVAFTFHITNLFK
jgi:hypothetical protein